MNSMAPVIRALILAASLSMSALCISCATEVPSVLEQPAGAYSPPVAAHGALQVVGNKICDATGNRFQMRGMSLAWSN